MVKKGSSGHNHGVSSNNHVADYFSILGVGDEFVWKHTQKQQPELVPSGEEEERFLREIVDAKIVCVVEDYGTGQARLPLTIPRHDASLESMASDSRLVPAGSETLNTSATMTTTADDVSSSQVGAPNSPSQQSETTTMSVDPPSTSLQHTTIDPPLKSVDGWTVLTHTSPPNPLDANLDWEDGLHANINHRPTTPHNQQPKHPTHKFYLAYRRRRDLPCRHNASQLPKVGACSAEHVDDDGDDDDVSRTYYEPALSRMDLRYVRVHRQCLPSHLDEQPPSCLPAQASPHTQSTMRFLTEQLKRYHTFAHIQQQQRQQQQDAWPPEMPREQEKLVRLEDYLQLPDGYDEWRIPAEFLYIRDPQTVPSSATATLPNNSNFKTIIKDNEEQCGFEAIETVSSSDMGGLGLGSADTGSMTSTSYQLHHTLNSVDSQDPPRFASSCGVRSGGFLPRLLQRPNGATSSLTAAPLHDHTNHTTPYFYLPVLAIRRQVIDEESRFQEEAALVDLTVSFFHPNLDDGPVLPIVDEEADDAEEAPDSHSFSLLGRTEWTIATGKDWARSSLESSSNAHHSPVVLVARWNLPFGFADAAFATSVLHRFPLSNYEDMPLPEEELPMFCYPTGCRLHRARFSDAPLAEYYGFVVKNERGDSIYVSCVSFMEPLTQEKVQQLDRMSYHRREFSLPHRKFWETRERRKIDKLLVSDGMSSDASTEFDSSYLVGFDDMTTFEKKTICLVSRYPFWTAFRKFLSHLHILSTSTSDLPLERYISHLLLVVPVPKAGGPSVIVPLPALNDPMDMTMPPEKDFPLVDLPYQRLVACLDVKTIVTIALGLLALERKVIVMSTRPSLVLDVCELLRSLIFPFDLCAPYVPRLTEPFQSSLDFPGALFVGIHKDGSPNGLAENVVRTLPEDSILIDLDTGAMDCDGDRFEVIGKVWEILPKTARNSLVSELETLCRDAGIVDGQEPLDSQYDAAFDVGLASAVEDYGVHGPSRVSLDDRAFRDAFLRFFCSVLGGYDRFLVVPDADFLVSGNEWFDAQGFLASVPAERAPYLGSLVETQLFQSFIQRRTEASDVHCLLFDECIAEYHSATVPYGRLGGDVETVPGEDYSQPQLIFSLLVDQSAKLPHSIDHLAIAPNRSIDASEADSSINLSKTSWSVADYSVKYGESTININGDFVTGPSHQDLPTGKRYVYCVDGNPCFPQRLNAKLFLPKEPDSWFIDMSKAPNPLLFRSEKELEDANVRRKKATSYRGLQSQRRCLWQLPKLMGSHFLGAWLLCIPVQVSQSHLTHDQQSRYLMRSLGALRLLRSKQRIVPDEAAYRALMVACSRVGSDKRVELVKLFGLLRSDGIFPSAVTLGQYTRALAEGYSKRRNDVADDDLGFEVTESSSRVGRQSIVSMSRKQAKDLESTLTSLDSNVATLEYHGRRWRHRNGLLPGESKLDQQKRTQPKAWLPVAYATSFVASTSKDSDNMNRSSDSVRLIAMWSRSTCCRSCSYIPLDEEIQAGWDVVGGDHDIPGAVACVRCGSLIVPMLGYREMTIEAAVAIDDVIQNAATPSVGADFATLPPQIRPNVDGGASASYVAYISPATLRRSLEQYVEEYGEEILDRETLRERDAEVFFNFWWYCARFSLPFPLPVAVSDCGPRPFHVCTFCAWDQTAAERGCLSAAKVFGSIFDAQRCAPEDDVSLDSYDEQPLLSRYNLQSFHSSVWDHADLSAILVKLVEACDKRDFKPVSTLFLVYCFALWLLLCRVVSPRHTLSQLRRFSAATNEEESSLNPSTTTMGAKLIVLSIHRSPIINFWARPMREGRWPRRRRHFPRTWMFTGPRFIWPNTNALRHSMRSSPPRPSRARGITFGAPLVPPCPCLIGCCGMPLTA